MKALLFAIICLVATAPTGAIAATGAALYTKHCAGCHGTQGEADTIAGERLNPAPRDLSLGEFKFKTTGIDDPVPQDDDVARVIRDGQPGTVMPGYADLLNTDEIAALVTFVKSLSGLDEDEPSEFIDYGTPIADSADSRAMGQTLYAQNDRCVECHGQTGTGDATKVLRDDNGARIWPRNLTQGWTYRAQADAKSIFERLSTGIPSAQMPSYADPRNAQKLTAEQRWHVANYVAALAKRSPTPSPGRSVIIAKQVDAVPVRLDDQIWAAATAITLPLFPQVMGNARNFTPTVNAVTVRALFDDTNVAFQFGWADRTRSLTDDPVAAKLAEGDLANDALALQIPVMPSQGGTLPHFLMGDAARAVHLWRISADSETKVLTARGHDDQSDTGQGFAGAAQWTNGTWNAIITRPRAGLAQEPGQAFNEDVFLPFVLNVWDGSNGERDAKRTVTGWHWLILEDNNGTPPWQAALIALALVLGLELLIVKARRKP